MSTVAAAAVVAAETELTYSLAYTEGKQAKSNKFFPRTFPPTLWDCLPFSVNPSTNYPYFTQRFVNMTLIILHIPTYKITLAKCFAFKNSRSYR